MIDQDEIPIFRAGSYAQGNFDIRKVRRAVENTNRLIAQGVFFPPVKLGHEDKGDASGWFKSLREAGGVVYAKLTDISADLKDRIARKVRRFVSAEIAHEFSPDGQLGKSVGPAFTGLAILGAERPQVKGLIDLATLTVPSAAPEFAEARRAGIVADGIRTTATGTAYFAELGPPAASLPGPTAMFAEIGLKREDFNHLASDAQASQRVTTAVRMVMTEQGLDYGAAFREARRRMIPASEHETLSVAEFAEVYSNGEAAQKVYRIMSRSGLSYSQIAAQVKQAGKVTG
ncbi:MAG TPA: hypothetical protein VMO47_10510 [Rhodothermales bacterium]|nr:hypothetical protein [Rhodothermales bacterium]